MSDKRTTFYDGPREREESAGSRQTWYFTFGMAHRFARRYFVVRDSTYGEARDRMLATFGREWAFQYNEAEWVKDGVSQAEKYGLEEIA